MARIRYLYLGDIMAGFADDVVYGDNVDFSGSPTPTGKVTADGQLLIGATLAPKIRVSTPTGSGGVTVTTGPGTLNFSTPNAVQGPASSTSGDIPSFADTTGKLLQDSGVLASAVVRGPASATNLDIAIFDSTTGKLIKDSGVVLNGSGTIIGGITNSAGSPAYGFTGTNGASTGFYLPSNGTIGFTSAGTAVGQLNTSSLQMTVAGQFVKTDTNNSAAIAALTLNHTLSSGTPAAGIGVRIDCNLPDSGGSLRGSGQLVNDYTNATAGSVAARWRMYVNKLNSQVEVFNVSTNNSTILVGQAVNRTATATDYTVLVTDYIIGVTSTAATRTITLPSAPATNQVFIVKDESGGATVNNITVTVSGGVINIDGATTAVILLNYGVVSVYWNGSKYFTW